MRPSTLIATLLSLSLAHGAAVSTNARCGTNGATCAGSSFGSCCSAYGFCGSSSDYCAPASGCQAKYGACTAAASSSSSSARSVPVSTGTRSAAASGASPTQAVSSDARCGAGFGGQTCKGSGFGNCCSSAFYCGSTDAYCGSASCQTQFGECTAASPTSSTKSASPTASASPTICNTRGDQNPNTPSYSSITASGEVDCIENCKADAKCLSTGYSVSVSGKGNVETTCLYFNVPVAEASVNRGTGSSYTFSDKAC